MKVCIKCKRSVPSYYLTKRGPVCPKCRKAKPAPKPRTPETT